MWKYLNWLNYLHLLDVGILICSTKIIWYCNYKKECQTKPRLNNSYNTHSWQQHLPLLCFTMPIHELTLV